MTTGNGRGAMRPHSSGRSPPFIVIGLLVVIAILGFNYWNVSSKNSVLARDIADLSERYRLASVKKLAVEKRNDALMAKVQESDNEVKKNQVLLTRKEEEYNNINAKHNAVNDEAQTCKSELDKCSSEQYQSRQTIKDLEHAVEEAQSERDARVKENEDYKAELQAARSSVPNCSTDLENLRIKILEAVKALWGSNAVSLLGKSGIDITGITIEAQRSPQIYQNMIQQPGMQSPQLPNGGGQLQGPVQSQGQTQGQGQGGYGVGNIEGIGQNGPAQVGQYNAASYRIPGQQAGQQGIQQAGQPAMQPADGAPGPNTADGQPHLQAAQSENLAEEGHDVQQGQAADRLQPNQAAEGEQGVQPGQAAEGVQQAGNEVKPDAEENPAQPPGQSPLNGDQAQPSIQYARQIPDRYKMQMPGEGQMSPDDQKPALQLPHEEAQVGPAPPVGPPGERTVGGESQGQEAPEQGQSLDDRNKAAETADEDTAPIYPYHPSNRQANQVDTYGADTIRQPAPDSLHYQGRDTAAGQQGYQRAVGMGDDAQIRAPVGVGQQQIDAREQTGLGVGVEEDDTDYKNRPGEDDQDADEDGEDEENLKPLGQELQFRKDQYDQENRLENMQDIGGNDDGIDQMHQNMADRMLDENGQPGQDVDEDDDKNDY